MIRAGTLLGFYSGAGPRVRGHVAVRWLSTPLRAVADLVPAGGRVLDLGCGHGLLTLLLAEDGHRRVHAVDVDPAKIAAARSAVERAGYSSRVEVERVGDDFVPERGAYDAVLVADVLYLLGEELAAQVVGHLADALRPGGRLVVKEVDDRPWAKALLNRVQETASVRLLGITAGERVEPVPLARVATVMADHALTVERRRIDRNYPHPHAVVIGDREETR